MNLKTARYIFKAVAIIGVPATGYLAALGGKTKAEKILKGEPYETKKEKVILNAKSYGPAVAAGIVTVGSIALTDYFGSKELAAAGALTVGAILKKDKIKKQFEKYRGVVKQEDGEKRDSDILKKASEVTLNDEGEVVHTYRIDWLGKGKPIYFQSTEKDVEHGLNQINRSLCDFSQGWGIATVSDALNFLGHKELANHDSDIAGWCYDLLNVECECYWLDFMVDYAHTFIGYDDEDPNVRVILVDWDPYPDLQKAINKGQEIGII